MKIKTKDIAYGAVVAAMYVALTLPLGSLATQPFFQIRPGEGLCLLPLLLPSSIIGLSVGCFLVNILTSSFIDALIGMLLTLIAGLLTRLIKNPYLGILPPVLINAFGVPVIYILMGYDMAFWYTFFQVLLSQTVWVTALGLPMYFLTKKILLSIGKNK